MTSRRLPIGIQDFETIRSEGFCYVDKTPLIRHLVDEGRHYFLSRPWRFGKSAGRCSTYSTNRRKAAAARRPQRVKPGMWVTAAKSTIAKIHVTQHRRPQAVSQ